MITAVYSDTLSMAVSVCSVMDENDNSILGTMRAIIKHSEAFAIDTGVCLKLFDPGCLEDSSCLV